MIDHRRTSAGSALGVGLLLLLTGCGDDVDPGAIDERSDGSYVLQTAQCARDVAADVAETDSAVRIDDVNGDAHNDEDCVGSVPLDLERPIGDRDVIVEGEQWVRLDDDCALAVFGPADAGETRGWGVPLPCQD